MKPCILRGTTRHSALTRKVLAEKLGRPIKNGYFACHRCDNPLCIEPEHLWEGTHSDNMIDASRKGHLPTWGDLNRSKTHCPKGHEYSETNTYTHRFKRYCKVCMAEHSRLYKVKKRIKR